VPNRWPTRRDGDGSVNGSSGSYQLTQITNSGGTAVTSVCPYIHFVGS